MKKIALILILFLALGIMGCGGDDSSGTGSTPSTTNPTVGSPQPGVTDIEVGSGGGPEGTPGGSTVTIYTVVVDSTTLDPIDNLKSGNFEITIQAGSAAAQECSLVSLEYKTGQSGEPISYAMILDRSVSMQVTDIASLQAAATAFVNSMSATDEGAVINFGQDNNVDQGLTTSKTSLINAIENPSTLIKGNTYLYDAIYTGINTVKSGSNTRKAVLAMTDGSDTGSTYSKANIIEEAQDNNVPVYTIGLGHASTVTAYKTLLQDVASSTGGLYYQAPTSIDLLNLYSKLSSALSSYYVMVFSLPAGQVLQSGVTYTIQVSIVSYGSITSSATFTLTL